MTAAQDILKAKGYATLDNRSTDWRNINKALDYGVIMHVFSVGKCKRLASGFEAKIALQWQKDDGTYYTRYYRPNIDMMVCGKWQSSCADVVGSVVLASIINFRQNLIEEGIFNMEKLEQNGMLKCDKCRGKGVIPAFRHYCKGVCFDCMGLGYGKQGLEGVRYA